MSNSFSTSDHQLQLTDNFDELEVIRTATNTVAQTFDLSQVTKVHIESGNYVISQPASCTGCYSQSFDSSNGETVTFTQSKMVGITIVRIEGTLKPHQQYEFDLESCAAYLQYQNGELKVQAPANVAGSGFDPNCVFILDMVTA